MNNSASPVVVTIGVFDGVHAGHRQVLGIAKSIAISLNGTLTAATFDPPPKAFLRPESFEGLLTLPKRRAELLRESGVDHVETLKFTDAMAHMSSDEFVEKILLGALNAQVVIVGRNFRFGQGVIGRLLMISQRNLADKSVRHFCSMLRHMPHLPGIEPNLQ